MSSANLALPLELEREIFEIASLMRPESMVVLLLVVKRVNRWIEPMLYRVLSIPAARPTRPHLQRPNLCCPITSVRQILSAKGTAFFGAHVRHLAFFEQFNKTEHSRASPSYHRKTADLLEVLSLCGATIDLKLSHFPYRCHEAVFPLVTAMPLQRFSGCLRSLFPRMAQSDFTHPFFAHITHLSVGGELVQGTYNDPAPWFGLSFIPHLTHLAWNIYRIPRGISVHALAACPRLQVLVLTHRDLDTAISWPVEPQMTADPRLVVLAVADTDVDWEIGARGGENKWVRAEAHVRRRRAGEIDTYFAT
ncbi:hypothetical protein K438DRAFT_1982271 [Mycena galopus ATCC 62051]|nr:hypothetical protein K438DRAFT_1982271 [Mycena galopus ATCC 62051]